MIRVGDALYDRCGMCGKLVQWNKRYFGSLHACVLQCDLDGRHTIVEQEQNSLSRWARGRLGSCAHCSRSFIWSDRNNTWMEK